MNKILGFIKKYRLGILSGLIVGTSYIPFYPWGLFFSYIPLWYWVFFRAQTPREAFTAAWVTQFTLTLIGFHWIAYTAHTYGGFPWPMAIVALLLFCALAHLYIPLAAYLIFILRKKLSWSFGHSVLSLALIAYLTEHFWPAMFPWHLGYTFFWAKLPIFHLADTIGFDGLSFLIYAGQAALFYFLFRKSSGRGSVRQAIKPFTVLLALFAVLNGVGYVHGQKWKTTDAELKILQVQANIGNLERMQAEKGRGFRDEIAKKYVAMSETGLAENPDVDLIVWPEVAIPEYLNPNYAHQRIHKFITDFLVRNQKTLLTGAFSKDEKISDPERSVFNALFLLDPKGVDLSRSYHKTELLAFGEYLPFSETFPILGKLLPFVSNFGRGPGPSVLIYSKDPTKNDYLHIGAQICYEGLYPEFTLGLVTKGAEIMVNVTNDSWFGIPFEPYQHLYMTLARSIESRRPLIRSTNSGITTFVTAYGKVAPLSPWLKEWTQRQVIPYRNNPETTFFNRIGHYFWIVILITFLGHLLVNGFYDKLRKS